VKGTVELLRAVSSALKFAIVGLVVIKTGGNTNNSSIGLNAVETKYTSGIDVKPINANITIYRTTREKRTLRILIFMFSPIDP
jgi:hypothetical protein